MSNSEWWRGAVIYQIYPRSFCDSNGDGIGDLPGIISKLDYVASLGVDAVWISPFFASPMKDFGYDISDYRTIDPIFGNMDDFKKLLKESHARGIKVILDQVWSHTSDEHAWFKESRQNKTNPKADWYIWADAKADGTPPNNWLSIFGGGAWEWDAGREQYYLHHFLTCQPALNIWNRAVREAIKDTAHYWLDMGVDGFRLDVINCALSDPELKDNPLRPSDMPLPSDLKPSNPMAQQMRVNAYSYLSPETFKWLNELRAVADEYEGIFLMGEIGGDHGELRAAQYTQENNRLHSAYSFILTGKTLDKKTVLEAVKIIEQHVGDGWMTYAFGNHDNTRFASNHGQKQDVREAYAKMGAAMLLSFKGSVCMYQGEELGLPVAQIAFEDMQDPYDIKMYPDSMNRDGARTPFPWESKKPQAGFSTAAKTWLPVQSSHAALAVDTQDKDENSVLNTYRRLLKWRKEHEVMRLGDVHILPSSEGIVAFSRTLKDQKIICVFNVSNTANTYEGESLAPYEYRFIEE